VLLESQYRDLIADVKGQLSASAPRLYFRKHRKQSVDYLHQLQHVACERDKHHLLSKHCPARSAVAMVTVIKRWVSSDK
jgi:hypothetical protein